MIVFLVFESLQALIYSRVFVRALLTAAVC